MRKGRALAIMGLVSLWPLWVFGDGTVSPPNPVGEKLYREHLLPHMLPLAIVAAGLLVAWVIHAVRRQPEEPGDGESHHR